MADIEAMRRRITLLESRTGALMVDADRRERRALERAYDCETHGENIRALTEQAQRFWEDAQRSEDARNAMVRSLILTRDRLPAEGEIPVAKLREWLTAAIDAQSATLRRRR